MPSQIPTIFKPSGVSFCQSEISKLQKGDLVNLILDSNNKYDKYAIKIVNQDGGSCGFVPRKMDVLVDGEKKEIQLNKLIHKRWEKMEKKYNVKVYEIYKWDGPTGYELMFEKKQLKA